MARERGTFNFSASLEVKKQGALDSRLVIQTYAELLLASTWADTDSKIWLYDGMIVSVVNDTTGKNGIYMLTNKDSYNVADSWKRVDAEAAEKTTVEDVLTSTSTTNALSANQGRVLKGLIDTNTSSITDLDTELTDFKNTKGKANGLASLDENGQVPSSQLPSYVDDVLEYDNLSSFPSTGEAGKIYVAKDTNLTYRWSGTSYVEISKSLAIGETSSTAFAGDRGKALEDALNGTGAGSVDQKIDDKISDLKGDAGTNFDTLGEIEDAIQKVTGNTAATYTADSTTNYIKTATSLKDADKKLDAQIKVNTDAIAALSGTGAGSVSNMINEAKTELEGKITDESDARKEVTGQSTDSYVANSNTNYIKTATSLNDADIKLDAQVKINADAIAALSGSGAGSVDDKISTAIDDLKGTATAGYDTLGEIETAIKKEVSDRTAADNALKSELNTAIGAVDDKADANSTAISALDTAVSAFKNKTVSTTIASPGVDTALPTTKAVVDYISSSTNGLASSMTYTVKSGDSTKMELKLLAVDGSTLSTVELDKENFISQFVKREATAADNTADSSIAVGDPILVVTTVNGAVFRVNLKSLVDVYTGQATNSITTTVTGYNVKADLKLDSTTQSSSPVKLTIGSNGLSANLSINSTKNGTNGITLSKDGSGLAAALKIDTATNTTNGVAMSVGANGLSLGIVWTEL